MQLGRLAVLGLILVALSGCQVAASSTPSLAAPPDSPVPSNSLDDPVIDSRLLSSLTAAQACALLSPAEASMALGNPLIGRPAGVSVPGIDAGCTYGDATAALPGTYIRLDISAMGFSGEAIMVNLHRGAHTLRVGGFEAIGADAETDPAIENAVLSIKLAKTTSDPALWIEAPTSVIAQRVAEIVLPRLAALP